MATLSDKLKELSGLAGVSVKEHLQSATSAHPTAAEIAHTLSVAQEFRTAIQNAVWEYTR